jgi:dTDP-4-amino-4,6-dideoxygalactose transaminase
VKVPFLDLAAKYTPIRFEIEAAVRAVFDDHAFILGPAVSRFEAAFAQYTGRRYCVGVNSGTSALHLALLSAGVGPGDEVVTTPFSWISTVWAISYCGARPVFADVEPLTGNLDPVAVERAISPRTRAIVAVDLYGNPAHLDTLEAIARRYGVPLIEDAAQAHGARLHGRSTGSFGRLSCFSFYPGKNLGAAGEAGAVLTDDAGVAERLRQLRDHAQASRHCHVEIGFNYRMEGLQGAVLAVKLRHLDRWNEARRAAARRYDELLAGVPGMTLPRPTPGAEPVWHLYVVRVANRDDVGACLKERGIGTAVHYPTPIHLQAAYAHLGIRRGTLPDAEAFASECLSLPMFAELSVAQQEYVAAVLRPMVEET